ALANIILAQKLNENGDLRGHAFNFSNEAQITVLELVKRILNIMESKLAPEIRNTADNEIRHQYLSAAKAKKTLGWQPMFTLDDGLRQTIEWYRAVLREPAR